MFWLASAVAIGMLMQLDFDFGYCKGLTQHDVPHVPLSSSVQIHNCDAMIACTVCAAVNAVVFIISTVLSGRNAGPPLQQKLVGLEADTAHTCSQVVLPQTEDQKI